MSVFCYLAPPTTPTISGYLVGQPLSVGDVVVLTCTASVLEGALSWYRGEDLVDRRPLNSACNSTIIAGVEVTTACRLTVVTRRDDNGVVFKCVASYNVSTLAMASTIRLNVYC